MPRFKDQAVCIRHIDWSETSQIVALFTKDHGKLRGLAKGSRRTSPGAVQRFSGGIELLTAGQVLATTKATTELAAITEWDLQQPFRHLRTDLAAHRLGMYAADLTGAITIEDDAHPVVFDALLRFLEELASPDVNARQAALLRFQWTMLSDCGYRPQLNADAHTGEALDESSNGRVLWFDAQAGGLAREARHGGGYGGRITDAGPWRVRHETVTLLRRLAREADEALRDANVAAVERANRLLCVYARALLDRQLPTMRFVLERGKNAEKQESRAAEH